MSRFMGKLKEGGQRLFRKIDDGTNRLMGKVQTQVFNNPRLLHSVARGLNEVNSYAGSVGGVASGLAIGLGQPELLPLIGASTALAGAGGHGANLLEKRAKYLENKQGPQFA